MDKFTAKVLVLKGDKSKPESAQHIIEFPGGAVELSRTTDGNYWAHIILNIDEAHGDGDGLTSALGKILGSRIDYRDGVVEIPKAEDVRQIAVLIGRE